MEKYVEGGQKASEKWWGIEKKKHEHQDGEKNCIISAGFKRVAWQAINVKNE